MSLIESVFSVIIIGLIITIFSFVPSGILQNEHDAKQMIVLSTVIDKVAYETELVDWSVIVDVEAKIDEILEKVQLEIAEDIGQRFTLEGEVVVLEGKEFIKVTIKTNRMEQEYFYGFDKTQ